MLDPYAEMVTFALFALMIGVVIFGGVTLSYFLDKRRVDPPISARTERLSERSGALIEDQRRRHDRAA